VQGWNFKEDGWPDDYYTECTFLLQKAGKGTKLTFTQKGIPEHKYEALKGGWKEFYWQPMKAMLVSKK
jgi:activator of HSP90 ATPase